jgi:hypothetical protein
MFRQDWQDLKDDLPRPEAWANTASALRRGTQRLARPNSDGPGTSLEAERYSSLQMKAVCLVASGSQTKNLVDLV